MIPSSNEENEEQQNLVLDVPVPESSTSPKNG
jgi:hypothetical protein